MAVVVDEPAGRDGVAVLIYHARMQHFSYVTVALRD